MPASQQVFRRRRGSGGRADLDALPDPVLGSAPGAKGSLLASDEETPEWA